MSYQVLARKYRPQKFSDVIGQEHVTRTLQNAIRKSASRTATSSADTEESAKLPSHASSPWR